MESKGTNIELQSYDNYNKVCGKLKGDSQAISIAKDVDQPEIRTHEHFERQRQPEKQRRS
ncbi:hypothetical protein H5410_028225 [Solanum commersonii]|uniref:Uncharacterized protein n=1 Tax=Solanum commersonii TaxID=4109 RepID=A0A9J5Z3F7_SOLCO|nr:hypothetical protein H5410_028225 [Solanum commersonii]